MDKLTGYKNGKPVELEIGKDYASVFGLTGGKKLVYKGGNLWRAIKSTGESMDTESADMTIKCHNYLCTHVID